MRRPDTLSAAQARTAIVAATRLARPRRAMRIDRRHLRAVVQHLGAVQIDSVNVLARAHLVPFFSRLGAYDPIVLERLAYRDLELFEYWGHAASFVDVELEPCLRWRMELDHHWRGPDAIATRRPELVEVIERIVVDAGALTAAQITDALGLRRERSEPWWGWDDTKLALEYLFWKGRIGAIRTGNFERIYCRRDRSVPSTILDRPTPHEDEAKRKLLAVALRGHGVGTVSDLADYWRLGNAETARLLRDMVHDGEAEEVRVEGWRDLAYRTPGTTIPRRARARALVSPFDVSMWHRGRIERVHGFDYRIEIYTPAAKRRYGYYTLPFLLGSTFVARVDLKHDRARRVLSVPAAFAEPDLAERATSSEEVAHELAAELAELAAWVGADAIEVGSRGDLSQPLAAEVSSAS